MRQPYSSVNLDKRPNSVGNVPLIEFPKSNLFDVCERAKIKNLTFFFFFVEDKTHSDVRPVKYPMKDDMVPVRGA